MLTQLDRLLRVPSYYNEHWVVDKKLRKQWGKSGFPVLSCHASLECNQATAELRLQIVYFSLICALYQTTKDTIMLYEAYFSPRLLV